ncbi:MAG TPA: DsbE family thiol:disulfide interchange protein [Gammaproteobacteria bacterium]|nr:DsbE family thiol:disulfide interchange protein [Gammaproteobacteria bacterium]
MWRYLLPLVVLVGLIGIFWRGLHTDPSRVPSPLIGKAVPDFSLPKLLKPEEAFSDEQLRGQVSLLNVWATWCFECKAEHPVLMQFAAKHDVPLYGFDYRDDREKALAWLDEAGNPYDSIAFDATGDVGIDWGVYGAPETFLIDANGHIRHKYIGPLTPARIQNDLLPRIEKLRAEQ